jgi:uncharacterized protein (TIGR04255 family)
VRRAAPQHPPARKTRRTDTSKQIRNQTALRRRLAPCRSHRNPKKPGRIIDIDVFAKKPLPCDDSAIDELLPKMRWLKNMVFFELLTPKSIEGFK